MAGATEAFVRLRGKIPSTPILVQQPQVGLLYTMAVGQAEASVGEGGSFWPRAARMSVITATLHSCQPNCRRDVPSTLL